jgi:hypothetical protein
MPAFIVFTRERMRDEKEYEIYKQKNRIAVQGHAIKKHALIMRILSVVITANCWSQLLGYSLTRYPNGFGSEKFL